MAFKVVKEKQVVNGKPTTKFVARDGIDGTGVTLPFTCGFCKDKDGKPTVAFRSQSARNRHTQVCPK